MSQDTRIWWIDEIETRVVCRAVSMHNAIFAKYIEREISNRYGSAGRGRVWAAPGIAFDGAMWDDALPVCEKIRELGSGGIAYKAEDHHHLMDYVGIVTDCDMRVIK